jgi:hypothetical protein
VRRLAPDSGQVKLKDLPKGGLEDALWRAMGREVANVHVPLGDVQTDLSNRNNKNPGWLCKAAAAMADRIAEDWSFVYGPVIGSRGHHQWGGKKNVKL